MPQNCRQKAKCYPRKDGKQCLSPNPSIVFLRSSKGKYSSIGAASQVYTNKFRPVLDTLIRDASKNRTPARVKALYHKRICNYFYDALRASGANSSKNKKKGEQQCSQGP
ncbi:unnamed protein product [Hapterophycus canaliculatus]